MNNVEYAERKTEELKALLSNYPHLEKEVSSIVVKHDDGFGAIYPFVATIKFNYLSYCMDWPKSCVKASFRDLFSDANISIRRCDWSPCYDDYGHIYYVFEMTFKPRKSDML